jgi:glycosyltransferase involved in cell wall biosynthesis
LHIAYTDKFIPSQHYYKSVRLELGVPDNTILIGLFGRYHPVKGHEVFLKAAQLLLKKHPHIQHFLLGGKEVDNTNYVLNQQLAQLEIGEQIHLLGERQDVHHLTAALDIASSSSYSEGFPNVIGEAMSCGVPCAVTDVGDSARIVGNTGRVVPANNPEALANAWQELIEMGAEGRFKLGSAARSRIIECFSLDSVVTQYETLYETIFAEKTKIKAKT